MKMRYEPIFYDSCFDKIDKCELITDGCGGRTFSGQCPIGMTSWGWSDDAERGFKGDA